MSDVGTIGSQVPPGQDWIGRAINELRQLLGQAIAAAGNAKAVAAAVQAGLANLASSGQTWQGPVNSGSGTIQTTGTVQGGTVQANTFNGGSTGSGTVSAASVSVGGNGTFNGTTGVSVPNGTLVSLYARNNSAATSYVAAYLDGSGRLLATPSARRFKRDISTYTGGDWRKIRAVTYKLRAAWILDNMQGGDGTHVPREIGVIAEELLLAGYPELVVFNSQGRPRSVHYDRISVIAIAAAQDLDTTVKGLQKDVKAIRSKLGL